MSASLQPFAHILYRVATDLAYAVPRNLNQFSTHWQWRVCLHAHASSIGFPAPTAFRPLWQIRHILSPSPASAPSSPWTFPRTVVKSPISMSGSKRIAAPSAYATDRQGRYQSFMRLLQLVKPGNADVQSQDFLHCHNAQHWSQSFPRSLQVYPRCSIPGSQHCHHLHRL